MNEEMLRQREWIFGALGEVADIAFQRATWLDPDIENPHYSYVECVECFYDCCAGDWSVLDKDAPFAPFARWMHEGVISSVERDILWSFHLALSMDRQIDDYDHKAILESASWQKVVGVAAGAVKALNQSLGGARELAALKTKMPTGAEKKWP